MQLVANIKSGSTWMSLLLSHFFTRLYSSPAAASQMVRHSSLLSSPTASAMATAIDDGGGGSSSNNSSSDGMDVFTPAACASSEFEMAYNPVLRRIHCCVLFFQVDQCQAMRAAAAAGGVPSNLDALVAARMSMSGGDAGKRGSGRGQRGSAAAAAGGGGGSVGDNLRQAMVATDEMRRDVQAGAVIGALASGFPVFSADKHLQCVTMFLLHYYYFLYDR